VKLTRDSAPFPLHRDSRILATFVLYPDLATFVLYPDSVGGEHEQQLRIPMWRDVVQIRTAGSRQ
jgi:hypothetical protein